MATGTTTSTQVPAPIQTFYDRVLLRRALPRLVHDRFGQKRPVSMNSGDQPKFRRYSSLPRALAPIVEGVTPQSQQLSKTDVTGQLAQYGAYVTITDYVQMTSQDRVLTEAAEILGENGGETLDNVYRDILVAGTNVFYANSVTGRNAVVATASSVDIDKIIRAMCGNKAKFFRDMPIVGMDRANTYPISAAFFAVVHPYTTYDLKSMTGFKQTHEYADPSKAMDGEIGAYNQVRFIETTEAKNIAGAGGAATGMYFESPGTATSISVFTTLIFGTDAYGITPLGGKNFQNIVKPLGAGEDALNQRSTSGWKSNTTCVILNDAFMYRYEHGASI